MNAYERLAEAEKERLSAENTVDEARRLVGEFERLFHSKLKVGKMSPCRVAILPDGKAVVVVFEDDEAKPNRFFVVNPELTTFTAEGRNPTTGRLDG